MWIPAPSRRRTNVSPEGSVIVNDLNFGAFAPRVSVKLTDGLPRAIPDRWKPEIRRRAVFPAPPLLPPVPPFPVPPPPPLPVPPLPGFPVPTEHA